MTRETTTFDLLAASDLTRRSVLRGSAGVLGAGLLMGIGGVATAERSVAAEPLLRKGSRGSAVTTLQKRLNNAGYWTGSADGVFGHLTQQAVWAVQKANGLTRDAVVGPATRRALAEGGVPSPAAGGGNRLEVHLRRQLILVVRGGATKEVYNTSTGNGEYYWYDGKRYRATTPTGWYRVFSTHTNGWQWGPLGNLYRPMYFNGGIAVHGSNSIPAYPASHGCCRLSTAAMDRVWSKGYLAMDGRVIVV